MPKPRTPVEVHFHEELIRLMDNVRRVTREANSLRVICEETRRAMREDQAELSETCREITANAMLA